MVLVWYPKCSTCQRAKAWLDEHGVTYTLRDIKEENPNAEELRAWHEKSGLPLRRFFHERPVDLAAEDGKQRKHDHPRHAHHAVADV